MFITVDENKINANTIKTLRADGVKTVIELIHGSDSKQFIVIDETLANVLNIIAIDADWLSFAVSVNDDTETLICVNQVKRFNRDENDVSNSIVEFKDGEYKKVNISTEALSSVSDNLSTPGLGPAGRDGISIVWQGDSEVHPSNPGNGWAYKNTSDGNSYIYQGGVWYQMTVDGVDGQDGEDGKSIIWMGDVVNPDTLGNPEPGWTYRDSDDGRIYIRNDNNTAWELMVLDGSDGTDGAVGQDGNSVYITYHNNPVFTSPARPVDGTDGTELGWHTDSASEVNWMSQKLAKLPTEGVWGEPILLTGQDGQSGISISWKGELVAAPENPEDNWSYRNTTNGIVYIYNMSVPGWEIMTIDGADGIDGVDAIMQYTWIKYAEDDAGANMSDSPDGKAYMGVAYNQITEDESDEASDYVWTLTKGDKGIPGEAGTNTYTWIRYADDINGSGLTDNPVDKLYIGLAYNKEDINESSIATDYTWSLFRGDDGVPGLDGLSIFITYNDNDVNDEPNVPSGNGTLGGWHTDATPTVKWISQKISDTASNGVWGTPICISGADGKDGKDGESGSDAHYLDLNSFGGIFFLKKSGSNGSLASDWTDLGRFTIAALSDEEVTWVSIGLSQNYTGTGAARDIYSVSNAGSPYITNESATITASTPSGIVKNITIRKLDTVDGTYIDENGIYTGYLTAEQIRVGAGWTDMPTDGADKTSSNTANDTSNIGGTPVSEVKSSLAFAEDTINAMSDDTILSISEKEYWRGLWQAITGEYSSILTNAPLQNIGPGNDIYDSYVSAKDNLELYLTNAGVWTNPQESYAITGSELSAASELYYNKVQNLLTLISTISTEDAAEVSLDIISRADKFQVDFDLTNNNNGTQPADPESVLVKYNLLSDGTVSVNMSWEYNETDLFHDIDGFMVYLYISNNGSEYVYGLDKSNEIISFADKTKRVINITRIPQEKYITIGVQAYRAVSKSIIKDGMLFSNIIKSSELENNPYNAELIIELPTSVEIALL